MQVNLIKTIFILLISTCLVLLANTVLKIENKLILILIQQTILLIPVVYFIFKNKFQPLFLGSDFSLRKALIHSLLGFLVFITISVLIASIQNIFDIQIPGYGNKKSYAPIFENLNIYTIIFLAGFLAPVIEEVLFRGLIFDQIKGSNNKKIAYSSIIFAIFHLQFEVIIPLLILGLILGKLRITQNNLATPIIFHVANNLMAIYVNLYLLPTLNQ